MVFNSLHFVAFFLVVYLLYRLLPHQGQNRLLLAASYYFYAAWDWRFLGLLVASTLIDYYCALFIATRTAPSSRRMALVLSLSFNLTMLGFFKYFNFFAENLKVLAAGVGWNLDFVTLRVLLPIGISFYTFITMSYVIDVYRRAIEPTRSLLDFAVFIAYFPHLVAGPILRASLLLPQIARPRTIRHEQVRDGLWLIAWGYFKKIFVADNLAGIVDAVFAGGAPPSGWEVLLGVYAFAFQIYGDFSGYSDIARGTSKLMGIELNLNFRFPYFVRTPQQFWRHWHISLSTWLRDYLYIPLGGNRGSEWQTRRNLLVTMILGGLWHGAAWTFVLWGLYQGLLLIAFRGFAGRQRAVSPGVGRWPATALATCAMFHLTCYGWLIFRARSAGQIGVLTRALFTSWGDWPAAATQHAAALLFYVTPLLILHAVEAWHDDFVVVFRFPALVRYAVYAAVFYFVLLFGDFGGTQFIYFQF
jgi:D-alanyl-lipoteichoic acid acyltransferase DltB (MBOAT superfamily)